MKENIFIVCLSTRGIRADSGSCRIHRVFCRSHQGRKLHRKILSKAPEFCFEATLLPHVYIYIAVVAALTPHKPSVTTLQNLFTSLFVSYWLQNVVCLCFLPYCTKICVECLGHARGKTPSVRFPIPTHDHGTNKYHSF